jgi:phage terminase small subunit
VIPLPGSALWQTHDVNADLAVRAVRPMPELPGWLDQAVDVIWASEQSRLDGALFNGRVFSADVISPRLICGHWTEFRRIVAQMRRPDLHPALGIRPLAVGGVITGPDGVIFGRRPACAVYQAGEWQLPPAGSVDLNAARDDGRIDVAAMVLQELAEELGLDRSAVSLPVPVAIVEHPGTHVLDLGMAMRTHLSAAAIAAAHAQRGNGEYDPLVVVPLAELAAFAAGADVNGQAPIFLRRLGLISTNL